MQGLVSLTDQHWFDYLSGRAAASETGRLDEVNFWRPRSQRAIHSIQPGAPFFLRLKRPHFAIAGFGFFAHWQLVPFDLAWELFGDKNGAPTREAFRQAIARFRQDDPAASGARPVGCIVLRDVVFLEQRDWLPWGATEQWKPQTQTDKGYDLSSAPGEQLLALIRARYNSTSPAASARPAPGDLSETFRLLDCDERRLQQASTVQREGQGTFKLRLLDAYQHRCAVTGERVVPVLDAAHIQDYLGPASNHVQNGLLLRTDLHRLYDRGLVTVTPDFEFRVSERLRDEWDNGHEDYALADQQRRIRQTRQSWQAPSRDALAWHAEVKFG